MCRKDKVARQERRVSTKPYHGKEKRKKKGVQHQKREVLRAVQAERCRRNIEEVLASIGLDMTSARKLLLRKT